MIRASSGSLWVLVLFLVAAAAAQVSAIDVTSECVAFGYDAGVAKWEWLDAWTPEGDPAGTSVTGNDTSCYFDASGVPGVVAVVVKAGSDVHYVVEGASGLIEQDKPAISHVVFCVDDLPVCGDGVLDEGEECDDGNGEDLDLCSNECEQQYCELLLAKSGDPLVVAPGDGLRYEVSVENTGTAYCTGSGVKLQEHYDARTGVVSASPVPSVGDDLWALGELAPGDRFDLSIDVVVDEEAGCEGTIVNRACAWAAELEDWQCVEEETALRCPAVCGDGVLDEGESCDDGSLNGVACVPGYGSLCAYCSVACVPVELRGPYCGDGVLDEGEECDDGGSVAGDGCDASCSREPLVIEAYKVVCDDESWLPDWGLDGVQEGEPLQVDGETASSYVEAHADHCWFEEGWAFQWGYEDAEAMPGDHVGPAPVGEGYDEWKDFDTVTGAGGEPAYAYVHDLAGTPVLWVREVLEEGYVPFSYPDGSAYTAGLFCDDDLLHTDDYEFINTLSYGRTYHCVAFNAQEPRSVCGDGVLDEGEECDGSAPEGYTCLDSCVLEKVPLCGDGVLDEGESCDDGSLNGVACVPGYGSLCAYCSVACVPVELRGPYCGDGVLDEGEECDGSAPEGYTCDEQCSLHDLPGCVDVVYSGPYWVNGSSQWIDTASRALLEVEESSAACVEAEHYYRYQEVHDDYCVFACGEWAPGEGDWSVYEEPFPLPAEACYVIEHYSDTPLGPTPAGWECVYVDKTPPVPVKVVGDPSSSMPLEEQRLGAIFYPLLDPEGEDYCSAPGNCYQVSMDTAITLSCRDEGSMASGAAATCYSVGLDGEDATGAYCEGDLVDGRCCVGPEPFALSFGEESWHELNVSCVDRVGKTSAVDVEYFKVSGELFTLSLNKKWNLVSVPFLLDDDSPEAVFGGVEGVAGVWSYDSSTETWSVWRGGAPSDLERIVPGRGYWVLTDREVSVPLYGHEMITPELFVEVAEGWNLVGYYGTEGLSSFSGHAGAGDAAACALSSLSVSETIRGYSSLLGYWEPSSQKWLELGLVDRLDPGAGYWLFATRDGLYAPATTC